MTTPRAKTKQQEDAKEKRLEIPAACACDRREETRVVLAFCSLEEIEIRAKVVTSVLERILTRPLPTPT